MFSSLTPTDKGGLTREILIMDNASTDHTPEVLSKILYDEAVYYYKAMDEGRTYTRLIISKERGLDDFKKEAAASAPEIKTLHGHEFYVITL